RDGRVVAHEVRVEDEARVGLAGEPVDVVLVVGDGGQLARLEVAVNGRLDKGVVGGRLEAGGRAAPGPPPPPQESRGPSSRGPAPPPTPPLSGERSASA